MCIRDRLLAIAMLSGYVPQGVSLKGLDVFKNMGKVQAATTLQNPRIVKDSSMDAGQRVDVYKRQTQSHSSIIITKGISVFS